MAGIGGRPKNFWSHRLQGVSLVVFVAKQHTPNYKGNPLESLLLEKYNYKTFHELQVKD